MSKGQRRTLSAPRSITVGKSVMELLAALPEKVGHTPRRQFTAEEDRAILANWQRLSKEQIGEALGCSKNTLLRRYRELQAAAR